jgi:hypothetical protein
MNITDINVKILKGNNSRLVRNILKNRWWLNLTDSNIEDGNVNILWS